MIKELLFMLYALRYILLTSNRRRKTTQSTVLVSCQSGCENSTQSLSHLAFIQFVTHILCHTWLSHSLSHTLQEGISPTWPLLCASFCAQHRPGTSPSSSTWHRMILTGTYLAHLLTQWAPVQQKWAGGPRQIGCCSMGPSMYYALTKERKSC